MIETREIPGNKLVQLQLLNASPPPIWTSIASKDSSSWNLPCSTAFSAI